MHKLATILVLLAGCSAAPVSGTTPQSTTYGVVSGTSTTSCQEDMDCWDCHTMGNRICGKVVNVVEAENAAYAQLQVISQNGGTWQCWAEINSEMPEGYEVICTKL
jgi:hypothetical protein